MRILIFTLTLLLPQIASADLVLAARTLRARTILTAADVVLQKSAVQGPVSDISQVVGLEARVVIYQGRPISLSDVGPAAIIDRNQIVTLVYSNGPLLIRADGRSLGRAGIGDSIKVMNLTSRKTVRGIVDTTGAVVVGTGLAGLTR